MRDHLAGSRRVHQRIALRFNIAEPRAHQQQRIRIAHPRRKRRVHADIQIASKARVAVVHVILPPERRRNRNLRRGCKGGQRRRGLLRPMRPAHDHKGPFGTAQPRQQVIPNARVWRHICVPTAGEIRYVRRRAQHIFRQRQHHWPRTPGHRKAKRARDVFRQAGCVIALINTLGQRAKHRFVINILKGLPIRLAIVDLADEQHHRRAVLPRHMHARAGVAGPRPARDKAYTRLAGQLALRLCHHRGPAFVAANDVLDAAVIEPVKRGQKAFARHREHALHAKFHQLIA